MNTAKENSKAAFNQQAATYDKDIKGQHARSLYPVLLEKLSHIPFHSALDLGCGTGEMLKLILQEDVGKELLEIIYVFLTIFLYLLKCPQSLILSALRAFCFCGKPHISRSIFLYFRYQAWLKSW